jgi:DNA repair protein RecN (Recombination protein N)
MLAMELALADRVATSEPKASTAAAVPAMTFVFDEVDAGVGGEAAVELGKRLARLARSSQVIVVTHLAQVASWADAQFVVKKAASGASDDSIETSVSEVRDSAREAEIARMLSGSDSETSVRHAHELLEQSTLTSAGE